MYIHLCVYIYVQFTTNDASPRTVIFDMVNTRNIIDKICSILLASSYTVADTKSTNPRNMRITMSITAHYRKITRKLHLE